MANSTIPTVDLSPFFDESGDEDGKRMVKETIGQACSEYGFFQIVNHGIPSTLMCKALGLSKSFFGFSFEEKLKSSPLSTSPLPAGCSRQPQHSLDKNEYLLMFPPGSDFNVYPQNQSEFREVLEEMFLELTKVGMLVESILNECLGLPPNFLKEYNHDRSWDLMVALHYFSATESENIGNSEHEDGNCITFVIQDDVGGLQVCNNKEWIPITPTQGTIIVNVGDIIQVLTNNKMKSATHRVVRTKGRSRHSFAFFYNLHGDKRVEPLPKFTIEMGESPKYRGFINKDYQQLRIRNKTHPPSRPEDAINIRHYAVAD